MKGLTACAVSQAGRLDVRDAGRHDEVQKGSQSLEDWTLKLCEGTMKSKMEAEARRIGR